jgi:hypothetical protein
VSADRETARGARDESATAELPFTVELLDPSGTTIRVLCRASACAVADAMFRSACEEFPKAHVVLHRGGNVLRQQNGD